MLLDRGARPSCSTVLLVLAAQPRCTAALRDRHEQPVERSWTKERELPCGPRYNIVLVLSLTGTGITYMVCTQYITG